MCDEINADIEKNNESQFDSPEKVAQWMREADFAFDFRGCDLWTRDGGISKMNYNTTSLNK